jgi:hypothetical protein
MAASAKRLEVRVRVVAEGPAAVAVVDMSAQAPAALGLAGRMRLAVALGDLEPAGVVAALLGRSPAGVVAAPRLAEMRGARAAALYGLGAAPWPRETVQLANGEQAVVIADRADGIGRIRAGFTVITETTLINVVAPIAVADIAALARQLRPL